MYSAGYAWFKRTIRRLRDNGPGLTELDLSCNLLSERAVTALAEALKINNSLTELDFSYRLIKSEGCARGKHKRARTRSGGGREEEARVDQVPRGVEKGGPQAAGQGRKAKAKATARRQGAAGRAGAGWRAWQRVRGAQGMLRARAQGAGAGGSLGGVPEVGRAFSTTNQRQQTRGARCHVCGTAQASETTRHAVHSRRFCST